ncbi:hypothetical protein ABPG72_009579 [Tetrahymena utriculariae]
MIEKFDGRRQNYSRQNNKNNMLEPFHGSNSATQISKKNETQLNRNDAVDIFSMHNQMIKSMDQRFEQMHNKMMKNFENSIGGFGIGGILKEFQQPFSMMSNISKQMDRMFSDFSDLHHSAIQDRDKGSFTSVQRVFAMEKKMGPDNKPYQQKYFSNNVVQKDQSGNTISERQQAYKNSYEKRDVIAQERMLNNQGRKFVQERQNGQISSTNHYLNMDENETDPFDSMWNNFNQKMGFHKNNFKQLGFGGGFANQNKLRNNEDNYNDSTSNFSVPNNQDKYARKTYQHNQRQNKKNYKEYDFKDDQRRGDYLPINARNEDQPVRFNNNFNGYGRRETDLQPTQPNQNRPSIAALPQSQAQIPSNNNNNNADIRGNQRNSIQNSHTNRPSVTVPARQNNQIPVRNGVESGVFVNRNNPKGALPKAG